ncbi:hypothetical protein Tco_1344683 [Tanacetum coccineum]
MYEKLGKENEIFGGCVGVLHGCGDQSATHRTPRRRQWLEKVAWWSKGGDDKAGVMIKMVRMDKGGGDEMGVAGVAAVVAE